MNQSAFWQKLLAILPLVLVIGFSILFFFYLSPDQLVEAIGLENAYFLMFVVAFLSGLTTFNTVPYLSIILVLASAGINPVLLGLTSALGVISGDSWSYFMGYQGATIIPKRWNFLFSKIRGLAERHPKSFPLFCFFYGAAAPLSNDFITISAGIAKIPYRRVMLPLALGNIVFNIALAFLAYYGYDTIYSALVNKGFFAVY